MSLSLSNNPSMTSLASESIGTVSQSEILLLDFIENVFNSHEFPDKYLKYKKLVYNRDYKNALLSIFKDLDNKYDLYKTQMVKNSPGSPLVKKDSKDNIAIRNEIEELKIKEGIAEMITFIEYLRLKNKIDKISRDSTLGITYIPSDTVTKDSYYSTTNSIQSFNKELDENENLQSMLKRAATGSLKRPGGKKNKRKTRKIKQHFLFNPDDPKKSFDVYIDKDPSDTIPIKYTTMEDVRNTIIKLEKLYKNGKYPHKRIWQVGMIMKVRLEAIKKNKEKLYPNAKNVLGRYNLANKYFLFLSSRSKVKGETERKKMVFKF
tara:strand:+ start:2436 stop:3395 length:960 start_codon:yes stop_codon:yes gene_type:complete